MRMMDAVKSLMGLILVLLTTGVSANGQLDLSFAGTGKNAAYWRVTEVHSFGATRPVKTLVQSDNMTLVISNTPTPYGSQFPGNNQIGIFRYQSNGYRDASYSSSGYLMLDAGLDFEVEAVDAALRGDGALLVLGTIYGPFNESDMAVWAILPSGQLDPDFADGGFLRIRRGGSPSDRAGAISAYDSSRNNFMIAGDVRDGGVGNHDLMQVLLFAEDGKLCGVSGCGNVIGGNVGLPTQWQMLRLGLGLDSHVSGLIASIEYAPNATLYLRTLLRSATADAQGQFDAKVIGTVFQLSGTGLGIDPNFGNTGVQPFYFSATTGFRHNTATSITLQKIENIPRLVIAGYVADDDGLDQSIGVYAMNFFTGTGDASFNGGNPKVFDYAASSIHGDAYANDVLATPDGKILVGGAYEYLGFAYGDAALTRLNQDGSFDGSFGNLSGTTPGRMGYGHILPGSATDRDNRLGSMALSADGEHVVFSGIVNENADGSSFYASTMRVRLYANDLLRDGFE